MEMTMRFARIAMTALLIGAPAVALANVELPNKVYGLTPERVRAAALVEDDALEHATTISTKPAYDRFNRSLETVALADNHLRAVIDRRTGATRYEVHQFTRYWGPRRDYSLAHYESVDGLKTVKPLHSRDGTDTCPNEETNGLCSFSKNVAFEVDEATIRRLAASYTPGAKTSWAFKLKDSAGGDVRDALVPAEAAGLLQAVDAYRATLAPKLSMK
jgi:hypothetical protein